MDYLNAALEAAAEKKTANEQAAQELGVSHNVVRNRIHRLRTRLRADLSALRGTTA